MLRVVIRYRGENKRHVTYLSLLQPPIVVLSVVVIEADGLEAKDVNGECIPFRFVALFALSPPPPPSLALASYK